MLRTSAKRWMMGPSFGRITVCDPLGGRLSSECCAVVRARDTRSVTVPTEQRCESSATQAHTAHVRCPARSAMPYGSGTRGVCTTPRRHNCLTRSTVTRSLRRDRRRPALGRTAVASSHDGSRLITCPPPQFFEIDDARLSSLQRNSSTTLLLIQDSVDRCPRGTCHLGDHLLRQRDQWMILPGRVHAR